MTFKKYFDAEVEIYLLKVEPQNYQLHLNDGDTVLAIVDSELMKLTVCEDSEDTEIPIYFIGTVNNKPVAYHKLKAVYIVS